MTDATASRGRSLSRESTPSNRSGSYHPSPEPRSPSASPPPAGPQPASHLKNATSPTTKSKGGKTSKKRKHREGSACTTDEEDEDPQKKPPPKRRGPGKAGPLPILEGPDVGKKKGKHRDGKRFPWHHRHYRRHLNYFAKNHKKWFEASGTARTRIAEKYAKRALKKWGIYVDHKKEWEDGDYIYVSS